MSVDPQQLALDLLDPVVSLDATLSAAVSRQIDAQTALQEYTTPLTDKQSVYVSVLAVKALIPRLLLRFAQELKKAVGGPAEAEFQDAIRFLEALQKEMTAQARAAALAVDPEDIEGLTTPPPLVGVRGV
jgi:hypothetical protein